VENDLVFPNRYGDPLQTRRLIEEFHRALNEAGLRRIRFHDLRHSCATERSGRACNPHADPKSIFKPPQLVIGGEPVLILG